MNRPMGVRLLPISPEMMTAKVSSIPLYSTMVVGADECASVPFRDFLYTRQGKRVFEAHAVLTVFDTLHLAVCAAVFFVGRLHLLWMPGTPFFHSLVDTCRHVYSFSSRSIFFISLSVCGMIASQILSVTRCPCCFWSPPFVLRVVLRVGGAYKRFPAAQFH